jgi:hypothetical protein
MSAFGRNNAVEKNLDNRNISSRCANNSWVVDTVTATSETDPKGIIFLRSIVHDNMEMVHVFPSGTSVCLIKNIVFVPEPVLGSIPWYSLPISLAQP